MASRTTRKMYDPCAANQNADHVTRHFDYVTDLNKFVRENNSCMPDTAYSYQSPLLIVDIDSALSGRDRLASDCDEDKYPNCGSKGCLLPNDYRIRPTINPQACSRDGVSSDRVSPMQTNTWTPNTDDWQATASPQWALQAASPFASQVPPQQQQQQQQYQPRSTCGGFVPGQQGQAQAQQGQDGGYLNDLWRQWAASNRNSDPLVSNYLNQPQ
jgi:hypothetical protein